MKFLFLLNIISTIYKLQKSQMHLYIYIFNINMCIHQITIQIFFFFSILKILSLIYYIFFIFYFLIFQYYYINFMSNNYDFLFKFIIIGDSNVGKSCLLLRFCEGRYKSEHQPTLGVEFGSKNIKIADKAIKIQIWDTAGQQSFKSITRSYYKGSIAALIVYDITKRDTFQNVIKWLHEVKSHSHEKVEILLIGNKSDLNDKRQIPYQQGEKLAKKNGLEFYETSSYTGDKVDDVFKNLATRIIKKIQNNQINPQNQSSYGFRRGKKGNSPPKKQPTVQLQKPTIISPSSSEGQKCKC